MHDANALFSTFFRNFCRRAGRVASIHRAAGKGSSRKLKEHTRMKRAGALEESPGSFGTGKSRYVALNFLFTCNWVFVCSCLFSTVLFVTVHVLVFPVLTHAAKAGAAVTTSNAAITRTTVRTVSMRFIDSPPFFLSLNEQSLI